MLQLLNFICPLIILLFSNTTITSQEQTLNDENISQVIGKWEGNLVVNDNKSIGILWNFNTSDEGQLIGFMGPASKGVATIPMQELIVNNTTISFSIHSQGSFSGLISETGIKGTWNSQSGYQLALYMARKVHFNENHCNIARSRSRSISLGNLDVLTQKNEAFLVSNSKNGCV